MANPYIDPWRPREEEEERDRYTPEEVAKAIDAMIAERRRRESEAYAAKNRYLLEKMGQGLTLGAYRATPLSEEQEELIGPTLAGSAFAAEMAGSWPWMHGVGKALGWVGKAAPAAAKALGAGKAGQYATKAVAQAGTLTAPATVRRGLSTRKVPTRQEVGKDFLISLAAIVGLDAAGAILGKIAGLVKPSKAANISEDEISQAMREAYRTSIKEGARGEEARKAMFTVKYRMGGMSRESFLSLRKTAWASAYVPGTDDLAQLAIRARVELRHLAGKPAPVLEKAFGALLKEQYPGLSAGMTRILAAQGVKEMTALRLREEIAVTPEQRPPEAPAAPPTARRPDTVVIREPQENRAPYEEWSLEELQRKARQVGGVPRSQERNDLVAHIKDQLGIGMTLADILSAGPPPAAPPQGPPPAAPPQGPPPAAAARLPGAPRPSRWTPTEPRNKIRVDPLSALGRVLGGQERAAARAYAVGELDLMQAHRDLRRYAAMLPQAEQHRVMTAISDALTDAQIRNVFDQIQTIASEGSTRKILGVDELEKWASTYEARGARRGFRAGTLAANAEKQQILDYMRAAIPERDVAVVERVFDATVSARTPANYERIRDVVVNLADKVAHATAVTDLMQAINTANKETLRPEFRLQLEALQQAITIRTPRGTTVDHFLKVLQAADEDDLRQIPDTLLQRAHQVLAAAGQTNIRDLSTDDLRTLSNTVQGILRQNQLKNEIIAGGRKRTHREVVTEGVGILDTLGKDLPAETWVSERIERHPGAVRKFIGGFRGLHNLVDLLSDSRGPVYEVGYTKILDGQRKSTDDYFVLKDSLTGAMQKAGIEPTELYGWSGDFRKSLTREGMQVLGLSPRLERQPIVLPDAEYQRLTPTGEWQRTGRKVGTVALTSDERMDLYNVLRDPQTRERLLKGQGKLSLPGARTAEPIHFTARDMAAFTASVTPKEKAIADWGWDQANGPLRVMLERASLDNEGFSIVERTEHWMSSRDQWFSGAEPTPLLRKFRNAAIASYGPFQPRTGGQAPIKVEGFFAKIMDYARHVSAYDKLNRPIQDAQRLITDPEFKRAVAGKFKNGDAILAQMRETLEELSGGIQYESNPTAGVITSLMRRIHLGTLAMKPDIALVQAISWMNYTTAGFTTPELIRAWPKTLLPGAKARAMKASSIYRLRFEGSGQNIISPIGEASMLNNLVGLDKPIVERVGMWPIHEVDTRTVMLPFIVGEERAAAMGLTGDAAQDYAARLAEAATLQTQPTGDIIHRAAFSAYGAKQPIAKLLLLYTSQRFQSTQIVNRGWRHWRRLPPSERWQAKNVHQFLKTLLVPTLFSAIAYVAIKRGYKRLVDNLFFGERIEDEWADVINDTTRQVFGMTPLVGPIVGEIFVLGMNKARKKGGYRPSSETQLGEAIGDIQEGLASVVAYMAAKAQEDPEAAEKHFNQAVVKLAEGVLPLTGLPYSAYAVHKRRYDRIKKQQEKRGREAVQAAKASYAEENPWEVDKEENPWEAEKEGLNP